MFACKSGVKVILKSSADMLSSDPAHSCTKALHPASCADASTRQSQAQDFVAAAFRIGSSTSQPPNKATTLHMEALVRILANVFTRPLARAQANAENFRARHRNPTTLLLRPPSPITSTHEAVAACIQICLSLLSRGSCQLLCPGCKHPPLPFFSSFPPKPRAGLKLF